MHNSQVTVGFVGFDRSPSDYSLRVIKEIALEQAGLIESS